MGAKKKKTGQYLCVNFLCAHTTFATFESLAEAEILTAEILHVVFLESSVDHLRCVVLAGQLGRENMEGRSKRLCFNYQHTDMV